MDKVKTPITYYGGKQRMIGRILPLIPNHVTYCEPFFGGGAIFFAKERSAVEAINDLNEHVVNFYRVCQTDFGILRMLIEATPHSRKVHREAERILKNPDCYSSVKRAWAFWVQTNMSFSSALFNGMAFDRHTNKKTKSLENKKAAFARSLFERIRYAQIDCRDAIDCIKYWDSETAFIYADPPYYNANMGHYGGYTLEDFTRLLDTLANLKGKFLLSSYPSDILSEFTLKHGWNVNFHSTKVVANNKSNKIKTEMLTANYDLSGLMPLETSINYSLKTV